MNILMIYENSAREYEGISLIKAQLEKRGHIVKIAQFNTGHLWFYYKFFRYDILVINSFYNDVTTSFVTGNESRGYKIVNMQYEQVNFKKSSILTHNDIPHESATNVYHICWGIKRYNQLLEEGLNKSHICVTGFVTLDLCRKAFVEHYKTREDISARFSLPAQKKWILFLSSFSMTFLPSEYRVPVDKEIIGFWERTQTEIINWYDKLLTENENYIVVYRPHPAETVANIVLDMADKHPNFKIIFDGVAREWMLNCDIICTALSTSITEAMALNKPFTIIRPYGYPYEYDNPLYENLRYVDSYSQFETEIKEGSLTSLETNGISEYYDNFKDERYSYVRIADYIEWVYDQPLDFDFDRYMESHAEREDTKYCLYKQHTALAFVSELMRHGFILEAEVIVRLLRMGEIMFGLFNPLRLREMETEQGYKNKIKHFRDVVGIDTNDSCLAFDLSNMRKQLYFDFCEQLNLLKAKPSLSGYFGYIKRLLNLRDDLLIDDDMHDYVEPHTSKLIKATEYLLTNWEYPEYEQLQKNLHEYITDTAKGGIIIYGFGWIGNLLLEALQKKRPDLKVKAVFDKKFEKDGEYCCVPTVSPCARYVEEDVTVFISLGKEELFFDVKKEMESLGYAVKDGVALLACLNMLGACS